MAREEITFTREEFYNKLWSEATTKVAKELGCSDVLIGKVCKTYQIPKPYLGYWAKLQHGKSPKKTPLPRCDEPELQSLTFYKYPNRETTANEPEPTFDSDIQAMLDKARSIPPIQVASSLNRPHPLVEATRERLRALERPSGDWSYYEKRRKDIARLDVAVSKASVTRALCIMDALVKRVDAIGGTVEIRGDQWRKATVVSFAGEEVATIRLREKDRQVRVPEGERDEFWDPRTRLERTGLLILDGSASHFDTCHLKDTPKRRRIEDGLNDLVIGFVIKAGHQRIKRRLAMEEAKRKEEADRLWRQAREELRRKREELQQRQKAEQTRVDKLIHDANSWRQSQVVREYLAVIRHALVARDGALPTESEVAEYLAWADRQADRLDPLVASPPSVLDETV